MLTCFLTFLFHLTLAFFPAFCLICTESEREAVVVHTFCAVKMYRLYLMLVVSRNINFAWSCNVDIVYVVCVARELSLSLYKFFAIQVPLDNIHSLTLFYSDKKKKKYFLFTTESHLLLIFW